METRIKPTAKGTSEPIKGKPGSFKIYFSLGRDPHSGKNGSKVKYLTTPKRTIHCKSKNPKNWPSEVANALNEYREELESYETSRDAPSTVAAYAESFHVLREGSFGSPLSYEREGYDVRHIRELFGDVPLADLRPDDIKRAYAEARSNGRFTDAEIRRIHVKLKQVMQDALENELIDRNPCMGIKLPKPDLRARNFLPPDELPRFTECLLAEPMGPMTVCTMLIFHLGLRKGEALGLSWLDYDPKAMELRIVRQYTNDKTLRPPKSEMSRRILSIDKTLADYLDKWRDVQRNIFKRRGLERKDTDPIVHALSVERDAMGLRRISITRPEGHNYSRWFRDFCVDNGYGTYSNVTKQFMRDGKLHTRGTGYSGLVPHGLRHTAATALVASNVDLKTVQARMGHASASTTANFYTHAIRANDRNAAEVFEKLSESE